MLQTIVSFAHPVDDLLPDIEAAYKMLAGELMSNGSQICYEAQRSAIGISENLRRFGLLVDDMTSDPDALSARFDAVESA